MTLRSARDVSAATLEAELVVVGSGAAGAMVAREVAAAGRRVILVEEGGLHQPKDFTQREDDMLPRLFQEAGGRATADGSVTVLQGRGVGGSTVHNTNLCKRAPDEVLAQWNLRGWSAAELAPHYEVVERDLSVARMSDADVNRNNALLRAGCDKLGWRGGLLAHNRRGCVRSGFCELGCAYDAKENALKILVPQAVARGAEVLYDCRATRVLVEGGRAVGVSAEVLAPDGAVVRTLVLRGAVCLAGSAVGSAALALRSQLPDPARAVGHNLRLHPGGAVAGVFAEPVHGWQGVPQSWECTEKLRFDESPDNLDRTWIITAFAHPAGFASMMPDFGEAHMRTMRLYPRIAVFTPMLHDRTRGRVAVEKQRLRIHYALEPGDARALMKGLAACAELMLAAGAERALVPFAQPLEVRSAAALAEVAAHRYRALDPLLTAVHPMGTLALGVVVDLDGSWKGLGRLWVADGSLFPSSLGGPPQLTIYAAAHKVAGHIVAGLA